MLNIMHYKDINTGWNLKNFAGVSSKMKCVLWILWGKKISAKFALNIPHKSGSILSNDLVDEQPMNDV